MQVSVEFVAEEAQYVENLSNSLEISPCDILAEKLRVEYEDEQRAIKELDEFLKPAVIAAKNGNYSDKTPDEIFKEVMDSVSESQKRLAGLQIMQ